MAAGDIKEDLQGRIESFDQSVRSLEKRLRAVERRLCVDIPEGSSSKAGPGTGLDSAAIDQLYEQLSRLSRDQEEIRDLMMGPLRSDMDQLTDRLEAALEDQERRLCAIEDQNRISIGSIKIPVELSGIAGAVALILTGSLIFAGRWDIIRSPYFSLLLAVLLGGAVLLKFYLVNKKRL